MNEAIARFWIALIRRTACWSPRARARLAAVIGTLAWLVVVSRRRVAMANLAACFPEWDDARRRRVARALFRNVARSALDYGVLWTAERDRLRQFVRVEGAEHLAAAAGEPLILLAPHFVGLDAGGIWVASQVRAVTIYARQSNAVWDRQLREGRARFNEPVLVGRGAFDLRGVLRAMREGLPLYYLPDMDHGDAKSIFVPFFGVPAATLPMVTRLAQTLGARVVVAVTEQVADGYVLHLEPPWTDFPGASVEQDTARMNREIERWVRRLPDQYLWTHRRFKTRPPGAPPLYK